MKGMAHLTSLSQEEVTAKLEEAGEEKAIETISALIREKYTAQIKKAREEGRGRGVKEKAEAIEKAARGLFEAHGIESENIEQGLEQLAEQLQGDPGKPGRGELTPESIRNTPAYKQAFDQDAAKLRKMAEDAQAEAAALKASQARAEKIAKLRPAILERLRAENANFGISEDKSLELFFLQHPPERFDTSSDEPLILGDDGEPMKDEYHNSVKLTDFLKQNWVPGFAQASPPKTPAPPQKPGGAPRMRFSSMEEYDQKFQEAMRNGRNKEADEMRKAYLQQLREQDK
jgi:hypothetical protein